MKYTKKRLQFLIIIFVWHHMPHVACPTDPEWTYREPYCYYNSDPTGDGRLSFDEAEDYCHEKGGHLASIHDTGEQEFINSMVRKLAKKGFINSMVRKLGKKGGTGWVTVFKQKYDNALFILPIYDQNKKKVNC